MYKCIDLQKMWCGLCSSRTPPELLKSRNPPPKVHAGLEAGERRLLWFFEPFGLYSAAYSAALKPRVRGFRLRAVMRRRVVSCTFGAQSSSMKLLSVCEGLKQTLGSLRERIEYLGVEPRMKVEFQIGWKQEASTEHVHVRSQAIKPKPANPAAPQPILIRKPLFHRSTP